MTDRKANADERKARENFILVVVVVVEERCSRVWCDRGQQAVRGLSFVVVVSKQ